MRDRERAEKLARAIEELVQGRSPGDVDDRELRELLQVAKIRLDAARSIAQTGAQYEGTLWQQVQDRLGWRRERLTIPSWLKEDAGSSAAEEDSEQLDIQQLQDVIALRRQIAEEAISLAEAHRQAVWGQVQARIQSKRPAFSFLHRAHPQADALATAVDSLVLGRPIPDSSDPQLGEVMHLARARRAATQTTLLAARDVQGRVWARIRPRLLSRLMGSGSRHASTGAPAWQRLAAAAAAVAVVAAALGPLPATGFAHHPVAEFVRFLGGHVGVSETGSPPTAPPPTEVLQGTDVTASRASELLGLPVAEPTWVPRGFQRVSSRYFPQALTGAAGGTFLLAYQRAAADGASVILIYQERPGSDIAIRPGSAQDIILPDATPATYISGSWQPSGAGAEVTWANEGTQTMVFDRQGLRTIVIYRGGSAIDQYELISIVGSLVTAP